MREPYEIILGPYRGHPLMGRFLEGSDPDFAGLANSDVAQQISTSETLMWNIALAYRNGDQAARLADVFHGLDAPHKVRVAQALLWMAREGW